MTNVVISKEIEWDMGHRVPNHKSKCRNPHGHRYKLQVKVYGPIITTSGSSDEGMVVDFSDLKVLMTEKVHDVLDHGFAVYKDDATLLECFANQDWNVIIFPYIPTAENIARWCWDQLKDPICDTFNENLLLDEITIWETPTSTATYSG